MPRVSVNDLVDFGVRLLVKKGVPESGARFLAETAARTEAMGVSTHGAVLLAAADAGIEGGLDPAAQPQVIAEKGSTALIDANFGLGPVAMKLAVELAVKKAAEHGVAMIAVRNASWVAGLGGYLLPLAREGFFAQLWAQSSQCQDSAPVGGSQPRFSTNPVALAFPAPDGPVVADFSTAIMSMGKVNTLARTGKKAPAPVFFTKEGQLTDDPNAMIDDGAMFTAGGDLDGHKGYALALWSEALTAMAGGSCNHPGRPQRQCFNLTVIDPRAFGEGDYYRQEMQRFVKRVKSSRLREGFKEIRLPGERALRQLSDSEKNGIDMAADLVEKLNAIAEKNGVEPLAAKA